MGVFTVVYTENITDLRNYRFFPPKIATMKDKPTVFIDTFPKPKFRTNQALARREVMNLLRKKLGITDDELNAIRQASLNRSELTRKRYHYLLQEGRPNVKELLRMFGFSPESSSDPTPDPSGPPTPPAPVTIPPAVAIQGGLVDAEGQGEGWGADDEQYSQLDCAFTYTYTPSASGYYSFQVGVTVFGAYKVFADDDWWESKEAYLSITARLVVQNDVSQGAFSPPQHSVTTSPVITLYNDGDDNIDHVGELLGQDTVSIDRIWLQAGVPISAVVDVRCNAKAKGDGSQATAALDNPNGFIACGGLIISLV
jgi:hypothetical protein